MMEIQKLKQRFGIIGNSPRLNYALETAVKVAPTDITVYIQGESGVGKESFSKIIHHLSSRKHGPFIAINCGAIPEGTINSELFGHEKGAFTGAIDTRKGYFESVNKGTIFLDEIGELPLETQSRLLRLLENGEFIKVGSSKVQKTDVRVIVATNKNLFEESANGKFREDLYYRLSGLPILVPPLRERPNDIPLLFRKFAMDISENYRSPEKELTPEAEHRLMTYSWPGNIRQLKNITEQIAILETNQIIDPGTLQKYLPKESRNLPAIRSTKSEGDEKHFSERDLFYKVLFDLKSDVTELKKLVVEILASGNTGEFVENHQSVIRKVLSTPEDSNEVVISRPTNDYDQNESHIIIEPEETVNTNENLSLEDNEEGLIRKALLKNNGRRKRAANDLGISERTLYRKIKQYELD